MTPDIRPETAADAAAIYALTKAAFAPMSYAAGDEQDLINALRAAGALALSLVAVEANALIGHVALSPVTHDSGQDGWFGLGPISVSPHRQRQGIGGALIASATDWLRAQNAHGCILVGNPKYYSRHGFSPAPDHCPDSEPPQFFMAMTLRGAIPPGRFRFHPAFYA